MKGFLSSFDSTRDAQSLSVAQPDVIVFSRSAESKGQGPLDETNLKILMVSAQRGNKCSYESLLLHCEHFIRSAACHAGARGALAEAIVDGTLHVVHRSRHTYNPKHSFTYWLDAITRHCLVQSLDGNITAEEQKKHRWTASSKDVSRFSEACCNASTRSTGGMNLPAGSERRPVCEGAE